MGDKVLPLGDYVLLQIIEQEKTAGGLFIPEKARGNMRDAQMGRVLAVGPGRMSEYGARQEVDVVPGDTVLIPRGLGIQVEHEAATMRILRCSELLCKVEQSRLVSV